MSENNEVKVVHTISLDLGDGKTKEIGLRALKVGDSQDAAIVAGERCKDNNVLGFTSMVQSELFRMLLVSVDGKVLTGLEKKKLGDFFTGNEHNAALGAFSQIVGNVPAATINFTGA